ncbi:MAG: IS4 family transposase [Acidiferrobacterales bacterium]
MHAVQLLHKRLQDTCPHIHTRRLTVLITATATLTRHHLLTITELGRALISDALVKHNIKRMDRLVGNALLFAERAGIYAALAKWLLGSAKQPTIIVDWSDLTEDRQWQLLRASVPAGGRALTLYEEVHPLKRLANRRVHRRFLANLKSLLPSGLRPILVTDAGFRATWFKMVSALDWDWVARIRNRDFVRLQDEESWKPCKALHARATTKAKALGEASWVRSNPTPCTLHLVRKRKQGRIKKSAFGERVCSSHSRKCAAREREPWLLAASLGLGDRSAQAIVGIYRARMQIEEAFRDIKSERLGLGLSASHTRDPERLSILLLIGALALFLLWLAGSASIKQQTHRHYQSNTTRDRLVLSAIYLGMQIMRRTPAAFTRQQLLCPIVELQAHLIGGYHD